MVTTGQQSSHYLLCSDDVVLHDGDERGALLDVSQVLERALVEAVPVLVGRREQRVARIGAEQVVHAAKLDQLRQHDVMLLYMCVVNRQRVHVHVHSLLMN